jgi:hypothetical protein
MVGSRLEQLALVLGAALAAFGCGPEFSSDEADAGATGEVVSKDGLVYWFSADSGVTQDSGRVSKWKNRAGNGLDAVQISENSRPKLDHFGDSNHPALEFDGEDDFLGLPPLTATFESGLSIFAMARNDGNACQAMLEVSNGPEIDDISFLWDQAALQYEVFTDVADGQSGAFTTGEPRLLGVVHDPSGDVSLWMNGLANGVAGFGLPVQTNRNQNFVGRTLYQGCPTWTGEIAELIFYARALEPSERQSVEGYLEQKWGCCGN